jgi:hypothetical protein
VYVPSARAVVSVTVALPPRHVAVPTAVPSTMSVIRLLPTHGMVNAGCVIDVMLSVFEDPLSVAAVMSGATVGVAGTLASIVMVRAGEMAEMLPAKSVSVDVTECVPDERFAGTVIVTVPPTHTELPTAVPSTTSVTLLPVVQAIVKAGFRTEVMLSVIEAPESVAAVMSGAIVGVAGAMVSIVTVSAGDGAEVLPAGSVSVDVTVWVPSVNAVVIVIVAVPPTHTALPTAVPSTMSVTVLPVVHVMVNAGFVCDVMSSIEEAPVSVAAVMSGPAVGAAGAVESTVTVNVGDAAEVLPVVSVSVNVTAWAPSVSAADDVIVAMPPMQVAVPTLVPSISSVTVLPFTQASVNVGAVTEVRLSVFDEPLSVAAVRSGALTGVTGAVASIVMLNPGEAAETLPAGSVSV